MMLSRLLVSIVVAITCVAAQQPVQPDRDANAAAPQDDGDVYLARSVRAVGERIAAIVQVNRAPSLVPVRADETIRSTEAVAKARALLTAASAAARGRAWRDLGFGSGSEPMDLILALERDVPGMGIDATRLRLLVDPGLLLPDSGHGDPEADPGATVLLATGVAPDEPIVGHYEAHAFLDGTPLEAPVTTDALLARRALEEGSANLAALMLLFGGVGLESDVMAGSLRPEEVMGGRLVPERMRSAGPVITNLLEFVYLDGFAQAASLARKGGFGRLAQELRSRRTTRDVLHVDRTPMPEVSIPPPSLPTSLALSAVDRDSLGEQGIIALVSLLTGKDNLGLIAGDGWVADSLWRFEPGEGSTFGPGDGGTIWVTRWKSDEDAADFSYGLERCLQSRFPGEIPSRDAAQRSQVLRRPDRVYRLELSASEVIFRVATPAIDAKMHPEPKKKGPVSRPGASKNYK